MGWTNEEMDFVKNKLDTLGDVLNNFPKGGKLTIHKDGTHTLTVPKMKNMIEIFEKYDTDKNSRGHNYAPYYEKHLPKTAKKILEIGVDKGQSILMWHELFPEAMIFGLDLFEVNPIPFREDWVTWFRGSQTDGKMLSDLRIHAPYDFIIEDGSHNSRDQLITFYGLVDCSPLYICEDLQCCREEFYRQGMKFESTMLGQMLQPHIGFSFYYDLHNEKIAFIR